MKEKISVITQARMSSTRLPEKVLKEVEGKPLLWHHLKRVELADNVNRLIVATSDKPKDDPISDFCKKFNYDFFRGSEEDVLARYYNTAKTFKIDYIIRLTADCPLLDFRIIDEMVESYFSFDIQPDYFSNILARTFPDGQDVEIMKYEAIEEAYKKADCRDDREHVTPYIKRNSIMHSEEESEKFFAENYELPVDFSHIRLTVDYPEDYKLVKFLLQNSDLNTPWLKYVSLMTKNPKLFELNSQYTEMDFNSYKG